MESNFALRKYSPSTKWLRKNNWQMGSLSEETQSLTENNVTLNTIHYERGLSSFLAEECAEGRKNKCKTFAALKNI